jgi:hypothetical protein
MGRGSVVAIGSAVMLSVSVGENRAHGLLRGRSGSKRPGPATLWADYFPSAAEPPLHRETK